MMRPSVLEHGHLDFGRARVLRGAHLAANECPFFVRIHTETTRMESAGAIDVNDATAARRCLVLHGRTCNPSELVARCLCTWGSRGVNGRRPSLETSACRGTSSTSPMDLGATTPHRRQSRSQQHQEPGLVPQRCHPLHVRRTSTNGAATPAALPAGLRTRHTVDVSTVRPERPCCGGDTTAIRR